MSGISLADIVALAKQGYKVSDVKELIALASSEETPPKDQDDKPKGEKTEQPPEKEKEPSKSEALQKPTEDPDKVTAIDEYKKKIEELENKVQKLQSDNVNKDNSGKHPDKTDEEILDDITRSFM